MIDFEDLNREQKIKYLEAKLQKVEEENLWLKKSLRRYYSCDNPMEVMLKNQNQDKQDKINSSLLDIVSNNKFCPCFIAQRVFIYNEDKFDYFLEDYPEDKTFSNFVFVQFNQLFCEFVSKKREDILGKNCSEIPPFNQREYINYFSSYNRTQEFKVNIHDYTYHFVYSNITEDYFFVMFENITPNLLADDKVEENIKFTQSLVDAIPIPVFFKDAQGRYVHCNSHYANKIIGTDPKAIIGKSAQELDTYYPKDLADFYQEKDLELLKDNQIQIYQGKIKCADGIRREFIVNKVLIKNEKNKSVGILGVLQDVDNIIKAQKQLQESEERYKRLFNDISQPIIVADIMGNIIMINACAIELFEETEDDIYTLKNKQNIPALSLVDSNEIRKVTLSQKNSCKEVKIISKGQERWYNAVYEPINDFFDEKVVQIICYDITSQKEYQQQILSSKLKIEKANNLKTTFLANIAHEVRTPMNIINGFAQLLQSVEQPEKRKIYIDNIYKNCNKLNSIIDDIVEISMIENGNIEISKDRCSINSILEDAYGLLVDENKEQGKNLKLEISQNSQELIYADYNRVHQIFRKLISNAITYTNDGFVKIGACIKNDFVEFFVHDSGIGIQQDKLNVIFERFRQGDEGDSRRFGGNGLGLSICYELVKKMGGDIFVNTIESIGSKFVFSIPYRKATIKD